MEYIYECGLESERLTTRFVTEKDIEVWTDFFEDGEAEPFIPTFNLTDQKERAAFWINKQLGRYSENRYGLQALIEKSTGNFVGMCGLLLQNIEDQDQIEIGYHILKKYRGKGYATEAAELFKKYAFENNITDTLISIILVENFKSQAVALKNGMRQRTQLHWQEKDVFIFEIGTKLKIEN